VAEKLRFSELTRQPRAVQIHERLGPARAVLVNPARQHALTRAGLTQDEHRYVRSDGGSRHFLEPADGAAVTQEGRRGCAGHGGRERALSAVALLVERASHQDLERLEIDRFGQEVLGTGLDGPDREIDGAQTG
jgi:hypothetical protein